MATQAALRYAASMIVFLHGVPETSALWDKVRAQFDRETVALSLPGFGCARPDGFSATKDAYAQWLVDELEKIDEPVDLVGHDWGALLTYRVASTRGDLLRSWIADVANGAHPDVRWHEFAKVWQTPGEGEAYFAAIRDLPVASMAEAYEAYHLGHEDAMTLARWSDDTMAGCILDLYRSAVPNIFATWGAQFGPTAAPGTGAARRARSLRQRTHVRGGRHHVQCPSGDDSQRRTLVGTRGTRGVGRHHSHVRRLPVVRLVAERGPFERALSVPALREDERHRERHHRERQGAQGALRGNEEEVAVDRTHGAIGKPDLTFDGGHASSNCSNRTG